MIIINGFEERERRGCRWGVFFRSPSLGRLDKQWFCLGRPRLIGHQGLPGAGIINVMAFVRCDDTFSMG